MTLRDRIFRCNQCGNIENRDTNAANVILDRCTVGMTGIEACKSGLSLMSSYLLGESLNISTAKFAKNAKLSSNIFANFARFAVRFTPAGLWTLSLSCSIYGF